MHLIQKDLKKTLIKVELIIYYKTLLENLRGISPLSMASLINWLRYSNAFNLRRFEKKH
jgi:hypothetical protein